MPNSGGLPPGLEPEAKIAALDVQVFNLGRQFTALETSTSAGFMAVTNRLDKLSQDINSGQKTPWPTIWAAMGVGVVILGSLGTVIYAPISSGLADAKASISDLRKDTAQSLTNLVAGTVSRQEMDWRTDRGAEDRKRTESALAVTVPRPEYDERWRGADQRFVDLQRQMDEQKRAFGDSYSLRDALLEMRAKIDRLEAASDARRPSS